MVHCVSAALSGLLQSQNVRSRTAASRSCKAAPALEAPEPS